MIRPDYYRTARRRGRALEWVIALPIAGLCVWYLVSSAHDIPEEVPESLMLPALVDVPNECPDGYKRGDFVEGGKYYTCWRKDDGK